MMEKTVSNHFDDQHHYINDNDLSDIVLVSDTDLNQVKVKEDVTYYLLKNLEVITDAEYWRLLKKNGHNQSPPIRSSVNKDALEKLAKRKRHE